MSIDEIRTLARPCVHPGCQWPHAKLARVARLMADELEARRELLNPDGSLNGDAIIRGIEACEAIEAESP